METFLLTNISTLEAVLILCITFEEVFNLIAAISIDTRQLIFDLLSPSIHLFRQSRSIIPFNISIRIDKILIVTFSTLPQLSQTTSFLKFVRILEYLNTSQFYPSLSPSWIRISTLETAFCSAEFWNMLNTDLEFPREKRRKRERGRKGKRKTRKKRIPSSAWNPRLHTLCTTHGQIVAGCPAGRGKW